MGRDDHGKEGMIEHKRNSELRVSAKYPESDRKQRAHGVAQGVRLQRRREAGGHLPGIREDQDLAPPERRKLSRLLRTRRLHPNLRSEQGLERLIAFCLVVLDARLTIDKLLPATAAGCEFTGPRPLMFWPLWSMG